MTKPISQWTQDDLEALIGEREGSSLEFKSAAALTKSDHHRAELIKDVTALANAGGGLIIYGIVEKGEVASHLEGSLIPRVSEWLDQLITTNIEPRITGLNIHSIALTTGGYAYVINIPQATNLAPHQSMIQKQYFRRYDTTSQPMLDHEIRDLMRRGSSPDLHLNLRLVSLQNDNNRFVLFGEVENRASEPCLYMSTMLSLDVQSDPQAFFRFEEHSSTITYLSNRVETKVYTKPIAVPHFLPIFIEQPLSLYHMQLTVPPRSYCYIEYRLSAPGCLKHSRGYIMRYDRGLPKFEWHD